MKSILLVKKRLGLVEMTSGLVNASFKKNDFLCTLLSEDFNCHCDLNGVRVMDPCLEQGLEG